MACFPKFPRTTLSLCFDARSRLPVLLQNMRATFLNIGERCNVAGSTIYKKAIVEGNWDKAVQIANSQVLFS